MSFRSVPTDFECKASKPGEIGKIKLPSIT